MDLTDPESPVAVLLEKDSILPSERDIRLEDYLNDKFQTPSDFAALDQLISQVDRQASQFKDQLEDARSKLAEAKRASQNHTALVLKQTADYQAQQANINKRMSAISNSESTDDAVKRLEKPMKKLQHLELASAYVELLLEVDKLAAEARAHLPGDVNAALAPYLRLKGFADNLVKLQPAADDAAAHLVAYVQSRQELLYKDMKEILEQHFKEVLGRQDWTEDNYKYRAEFRDIFKKLLDLQAPEIACEQVRILLPMKVLAGEQIARFRWHFIREDSKTAVTTKPKEIFDWVCNNLENYRAPLSSVVGPILSEHFRECSLPLISIYLDPIAAWLTAFLPVVREKVDLYLDQNSDNSPAMHQMFTSLVNFDKIITYEFKYDGGDTSKPWEGLAGDVLVDWFDIWLAREKAFATKRCDNIISQKSNTALDYESFADGKTKPTIAATLIVALIEGVTKTYNKIPRMQYKIRFFLDVQVPVLITFNQVLKSTLITYKANRTTIGRTINGVSKEQQAAIEGIAGLETLCKVFNSADFIINHLKDWMMDPFFIDLYDDLRGRAISKKEKRNSNLAGPLSYSYVMDRTSPHLNNLNESGTLFDYTIDAFREQKDDAESLIKEALSYALVRVFKPYTTKPQWTTIDESDRGQIEISEVSTVTGELVEGLRWINAHTELFRKTVSKAAFHRIISIFMAELQDHIWNEVLLRSHFTNVGAAQFGRDMQAIFSIVELYFPNAVLNSNVGMPKLREAVRVLNLPSINSCLDDVSVDEEEDEDEEKEKPWLEDVYVVFKEGGLEANETAAALKCEVLSVSDVQMVLKRRVECDNID